MAPARILRIYLDAHLQRRVAEGRHNFLGQVMAAFRRRDVAVEICPDDDAELLLSPKRDGFALFHMIPPPGDNGLSFRLAHVFPFWNIERSAARWEFDIARKAYDPSATDPDEARDFTRRARRRLFPWAEPENWSRDFVYVPLQGQLLTRRSFQTRSPIDMLAETLAAFPDDAIMVTLHPGETYVAEVRAALRNVLAGHPRAALVSEKIETLLPRAKLIVTENSSVAFKGYFLEKPAVLFARSDFHHIAANAGDGGSAAVFQAAMGPPPDFARYLLWFLQQNAINAGRGDVQDRIIARVRELGWEV